MFKFLHFLLTGYAAVGALWLAFKPYGGELTPMAILLGLWLGALIGLGFAWLWFARETRTDAASDQRDTHAVWPRSQDRAVHATWDTDLYQKRAGYLEQPGRGVSLARDISRP